MALFSKLNKQCFNKLYTKLVSPAITNHLCSTRCLASLNISGIYPPITTPFDEGGNIKFEKIMYNLEKWKSVQLRGYVVMGSTGEFVSLTEDEKIQIVKCVKKASSVDKLIIVGTGCQSTRETIELTNKMADNGANAALVISPFFYKGRMNDDALYDHYIKVADGSKIPIILYSVPANTNLDLSSSLVAKLSEHPNIIGMKDSGGDITKIAHIVHKTKTKDFQVLAGSAGFLYPALCVGCVGGVVALANPLSKQLCELYQYAMDGKHDEARNLQHRLIGPNLCVTKLFGIPGVKAAMDLMGFFGGSCRLPLKAIRPEELIELKKEFKNNGFL